MNSTPTSDHQLKALIHELRTPIQSIVLTCELIQQHPEDPIESINEKLEGMRQSCHTLLALLDEAASQPPSPATPSVDPHFGRALSLQNLGAYLYEQMNPIARHKGRTLELNLADDLPDVIHTHPVWLEQTLRNLIVNAIRHGEGTVRLSISCQPGSVHMSVSDEGPGIPEDEHESIFKPRVQLRQDRKESEGMGLGLSLAASWVQRMRGTIRLTSREGSGSTFHVTLPHDPSIGKNRGTSFADIAPKAHINRSSSRPEQLVHSKPLSRSTILLVDDNELHLEALQEYLSTSGATIMTAKRAHEAVRSLSHQQIDAMVLDLNLPDSQGLELIQLLRTHANHHNTPIILYTGESLNAESEEVLSSRVQGIRQKRVGSHRRVLNDLQKLLKPDHHPAPKSES